MSVCFGTVTVMMGPLLTFRQLYMRITAEPGSLDGPLLARRMGAPVAVRGPGGDLTIQAMTFDAESGRYVLHVGEAWGD